MAKTLQLVAPFVLYGRPSRKSVRDLLRKVDGIGHACCMHVAFICESRTNYSPFILSRCETHHKNVTMSPHSTLQRAFARIDKKRVQLSDNQLVEDHLGDKV